MTRKFLLCASLGGLLLLGALHTYPAVASQAGSQSEKQTQTAGKTISGKVASIGSGGQSFTLELSGGNKQTMDFVVDKNTQVQGQVKEGTAVTVEYQAMDNGKNLALRVSVQA